MQVVGMLRELRPEIVIYKMGGVPTVFSSKEILEEGIGRHKTGKVHLAVFRPIKVMPKIFIFDQNKCLTKDSVFELEYYKKIVELAGKIFSVGDRKKFITSVEMYGKDGCLSTEYNGFFPEDGAVCDFRVDRNGRSIIEEIMFPNGTVINDPQIIKEYIRTRSAPVPFLGRYDQNSLFWLLVRRGIDEKQFRKISADAYEETIANYTLLVPGFNDLLCDFFERFNHKKSIMMVATDNSLDNTLAGLRRMGLHKDIHKVFARVDKIHNYPALIRYIIDKYHVGPDEIVVFGDRYWSDIHPILQSEFKAVVTVHINSGEDYSRLYLEYGAPSIAAETLNRAFRYMLETIPERPKQIIIR